MAACADAWATEFPAELYRSHRLDDQQARMATTTVLP